MPNFLANIYGKNILQSYSTQCYELLKIENQIQAKFKRSNSLLGLSFSGFLDGIPSPQHSVKSIRSNSSKGSQIIGRFSKSPKVIFE
jgi:hypothetical protein